MSFYFYIDLTSVKKSKAYWPLTTHTGDSVHLLLINPFSIPCPGLCALVSTLEMNHPSF